MLGYKFQVRLNLKVDVTTFHELENLPPLLRRSSHGSRRDALESAGREFEQVDQFEFSFVTVLRLVHLFSLKSPRRAVQEAS